MPSAYIVDNLLAATATSLTSDTEDTVYTLSNLADKQLDKPFRWTGTTGGWIEADLGSALDFDTAAWLNHNFNSAAYILALAGASAAPTLGIAAPAYRAANVWADMTSQTYRYFKTLVTDANTVNSEIGELVLGERVLLPKARRYGGQPLGVARFDKRFESTRGVRRDYKLYQRESRIYTWRVDETDVQDILTFFEAARAVPFLWIEDTAAAGCFYARLDDASVEPQEETKVKLYDVQIKLSEESRGVAILA